MHKDVHPITHNIEKPQVSTSRDWFCEMVCSLTQWDSMQLLKMVGVENMLTVQSSSWENSSCSPRPHAQLTPEGPGSVTVARHSPDSQPRTTNWRGNTDQLLITTTSATSSCVP